MRPSVRACLLDLDDTLYRSDRMHVIVGERRALYLHERLGVPAEEVAKLGADLSSVHGTTLSGLLATGFPVDCDEWWRFLHSTIDYDALLQPDPQLRAVLEALPLPKHVFTTASAEHAESCLARLGIRNCFERVYDWKLLNDLADAEGVLTQERPAICKPMKLAYEVVLRDLGMSADEVLFADDSDRNVTTAFDLGMRAVLVGRDSVPEGVRADVALLTLHELPRVLEELFDNHASRPRRGNAREEIGL